MNMPPEVTGGSLAAAWERTTAALLRTPDALGRLHYQPEGGLAADRTAAMRLFARAGITDCTQDRTLITAGAQHALQAIVAGSLQPGDIVACARFTYPGFIALARRHALQLAPLKRIDAASLEQLCREKPVRALYVVPTNDNPTTRTIGEDDRKAIAAICRLHGLSVIEDDAYGQLDGAPLPAFAAFLPGQAWYVASTAKSVSPALRVAFLHCPSLRGARAASAALHRSAIMPPPLNVAMVARWIADGTYARLVEETRREARARQALAAQILSPEGYAASPGGYHLWVPLPAGLDRAAIAETLRRFGLAAIPSDTFAVGPAHDAALRISLGGPITHGQLELALEALAVRLGGRTIDLPMV